MYSQTDFYSHAARTLMTRIAPPSPIETKPQTGSKLPYPSALAVCLLAMLTIFLIGLRAPLAHAEIRFEDITSSAGVSYAGPSAGASWGEFNGDGWPDLWVSNRGSPPNLFQNNKDGTFSEISAQVNYTNASISAWPIIPSWNNLGLNGLVASYR